MGVGLQNNLLLLAAVSLSTIHGEPQCSRFHYEEQLLEKMVRTEIKFEELQKLVDRSLDALKQEFIKFSSQTSETIKENIKEYKEIYDNVTLGITKMDSYKKQSDERMEEFIAAQAKRFQDALVTLKDEAEINWSRWSSWSAWSHCSGQCSGGYSTREQSRQRHRTCLNDSETPCSGTSVETDTRPCNMVELYGCLNEHNTNTSGNPQYELVYNFFDELALSTCTAALTKGGRAFAVRRDCYSGIAEGCGTICSRLRYTCFDALHIYKPFTPLQPNGKSHKDEGKQGLSMYRYFSCGGKGGCGPNYCCCRS